MCMYLHGCICLYVCVYGWMDVPCIWMDVHGCMDGWMDGGMDGGMEGWMDGCNMYTCVYVCIHVCMFVNIHLFMDVCVW